MAAIPKLDAPPHTRLAAIAGAPPDPTRLAPGCPFEPRCRYARERCRREAPQLAGDCGGTPIRLLVPARRREPVRRDGRQRQRAAPLRANAAQRSSISSSNMASAPIASTPSRMSAST